METSRKSLILLKTTKKVGANIKCFFFFVVLYATLRLFSLTLADSAHFLVGEP